ncbi:MAG: hypothetical protein KIG95_13770 [Comamonas sp.]|nr:hypothetical protein [Comamonas sp.]
MVQQLFNDRHLNRLLGKSLTFYDTARARQANDGQVPQHHEAANDSGFTPGTLRAETIEWLGGLHHSYRPAT